MKVFLGQQTTLTSSQLKDLAPGRAGVLQTLKEMKSFVLDYKKNLQVRNTAAELVNKLAQKNFLGEVKTLHAFVRDNIRYLRDIHGVETIQSPVKTLEYGYGDCDDKATLLCALLESTGHPSRFVAVGKAPDKFSHVYVETLVGKQWFPLETTEPVPAGWAPRDMRARMVVHN